MAGDPDSRLPALAPRPTASWDPIGEKHVELTGLFGIPVRHPYQPLAIGRKHGKAIELTFDREAFETSPVFADQIQMETGPATLASGLDVRRKDNASAIGIEVGREVRRTVR